jgi:FeS assembly SUF system protein
MNDRIIPLADAPPPATQNAEDVAAPVETPEPSPQASAGQAAESTFKPDPLNTLKFTPLLVEAVSKVFDPEIPVNIYELGLVYDLEVDSASNVQVRMTLTAPACPAAQTIPLDVERRIREVPGVNDVKVDVVWDPPWTRDKMSEMAKLTLGMY